MKKFDGFNFQSIPTKDWWLIIFAGIFGALSWLFYFFALKHGQAVPVVAIDRLSIVFVLVLVALFLGEAFTFKSLAGTILIAAGAMLISIK